MLSIFSEDSHSTCCLLGLPMAWVRAPTAPVCMHRTAFTIQSIAPALNKSKFNTVTKRLVLPGPTCCDININWGNHKGVQRAPILGKFLACNWLQSKWLISLYLSSKPVREVNLCKEIRGAILFWMKYRCTICSTFVPTCWTWSKNFRAYVSYNGFCYWECHWIWSLAHFCRYGIAYTALSRLLRCPIDALQRKFDGWGGCQWYPWIWSWSTAPVKESIFKTC